MFDVKEMRLSRKEKVELLDALKVENAKDILVNAYLIALESSTTGEVERTNLIGRMMPEVKKSLGHLKGFNRYGYMKHIADVSFQLYQMDLDSESPHFYELTTYRDDGHKLIYIQPRFSVDGEQERKNAKKVKIFAKSRATTYRNAQTAGLNWKLYCSYMVETYVRIVDIPDDLMLTMFKNSEEYLSDSSNESKESKLLRAMEAIEYLRKEVIGNKLALSPVPDARTRVAKYRVFFATGEELNHKYTWFINFFSESWRTNLYELWDQKPLDESGLESLKVAAARFYHKKNTAQRLSWRKSLKLFEKNRYQVLKACYADLNHGVYYPRIAKLIEMGVGTMTGFMLEADLSASGIGSAAMNIHSLELAKATALAGSATPADAHRSVVEACLRYMIADENTIQRIIADNYKVVKKINVELTHAQTVKTTAARWTGFIESLRDSKYKWSDTSPVNPMLRSFFVPISVDGFVPMTADVLTAIYDDLMPGLLPWIKAITSITKVGVMKGHDVLTWRAPDGVRCSTSAFAESRKFTAYAVDKNSKTRSLVLQMDMPIEIGPNGIVYEGPEGPIRNKMMGAWANLVQADDAWMKREITKICKINHGFVPVVKHDGYYVHPNNIKTMINVVGDVRKRQFELRPIKRAFEQIADFLGISKIELPDFGMKLSDMRWAHQNEAPFMMT